NSLARKNVIEKTVNLIYVLPMVALLALFIVRPIIQVINSSFYNIKSNGEMVYIGLENYTKFFNSPEASIAFRNTFIWVFLGVIAKI
ncbi:MAG: sugar ABC transporter permease, partial [Eubacteriales bacterium]|nr:sugar ABC transporter permease [Eubacteriales bacterium]